MKLRAFRVPAVIACVLLGAACATTDYVTGSQVNNMYSIQEDIALGQQVQDQTLSEMKKKRVPIDKDARRMNQLKEMVSRIAKVSHIPDLPYEVHLIGDDKIVNAMCAPGGKVMVFSGLYEGKDKMVNDEDEMAIVLGHEIAHANCRHTTEAVTREMPINALLLAGGLYASAKGNNDVANAIGAGFLVVNGVWFTKYSRTAEAEADRVGLMYAAKAGYDPRAAPRLWKRVYEEQGDSPALLTMLSSHPANKDRWKALEKMLPEAMAEYEKSGHSD